MQGTPIPAPESPGTKTKPLHQQPGSTLLPGDRMPGASSQPGSPAQDANAQAGEYVPGASNMPKGTAQGGDAQAGEYAPGASIMPKGTAQGGDAQNTRDALGALATGSTDAQLLALAAREEQVALRERQFTAKEGLLARGLPLSLLPHIDCTSDQALTNSLHLASQAALANQAAAIPKAQGHQAALPDSYRERAWLYAQDAVAYKRLVGE